MRTSDGRTAVEKALFQQVTEPQDFARWTAAPLQLRQLSQSGLSPDNPQPTSLNQLEDSKAANIPCYYSLKSAHFFSFFLTAKFYLMNGEIPLSTFARELSQQRDRLSETGSSPDQEELNPLNVTDFVYETLTLNERREHGVFFSGPRWAAALREQIDIDQWKRFVDPSVGIGDLLIQICQNLPVQANVISTLQCWADRLVAVDLRQSFLQIAWIRIKALAFQRHNQDVTKLPDRFNALPQNFKVGDSLSMMLDLRAGDCVIMNPPYQRITAPSGSAVGRGKRSAAALHVEHILNIAPTGVEVVALLPDVLRSGSSYKRFRSEILSKLQLHRFDSFGKFGTDADIDVAILVGNTKVKKDSHVTHTLPQISIVGDKFRVAVGSVVPHRTKADGPPLGYLTVKNSAVGSKIAKPAEYGKFTSRFESGPFVIVRRTSSPSDKKRARASLVSSSEKFLVENHLLILKPFDNMVVSCELLIKILNDCRTNNWLNEHIRCRHLTVGALKALPWLDDLTIGD